MIEVTLMQMPPGVDGDALAARLQERLSAAIGEAVTVKNETPPVDLPALVQDASEFGKLMRSVYGAPGWKTVNELLAEMTSIKTVAEFGGVDFTDVDEENETGEPCACGCGESAEAAQGTTAPYDPISAALDSTRAQVQRFINRKNSDGFVSLSPDLFTDVVLSAFHNGARAVRSAQAAEAARLEVVATAEPIANGDQYDQFGKWAVVELMGKQKIAGQIAAAHTDTGVMLGVRVPETTQRAAFEKTFGHGAIFAITEVDEAVARDLAERYNVTPYDEHLLSVYDPLNW